MVIDTSAILAIVFNEVHGHWCADQLSSANRLLMSTVNLAEVLILLRNRQPTDFEEIKKEILTYPIEYIPPSVAHAQTAAWARNAFPLNLGDCFAYALAKDTGDDILTLDQDFAKLDVSVCTK